jgi:hypothetical protein
MKASLSRFAVAAIVVVSAAGCASTTGTSPSAGAGGGTTSASASETPPTTPSTTPSATPGVPAGAVTVTTTQNGATIHLANGATLSLVGFPSSWQPKSPDPAVLADPLTPIEPIQCKVPPGGTCPLPPLNYKAKAPGTVKLTAHRSQCGEARACVPPESYDFALTVIVK